MNHLIREEEYLDETKAGKWTTTLNEATLDPFDPIERIKKGFMQFKTNEFDPDPKYYSQLAEAQDPKFLVFACSDSRVCPSHILNFWPGEAFMSRSIANLVPEFNHVRYCGIGAIIEYALTSLQVEIVLVIGHSHCGGLKGLMSGETTSNDFINDWVKIGLPAKAKVISESGDLSFDDQCHIYEKEAVNLSLVNLLTYPYVRDGVANKTLQLMGGHYDFDNGTFSLWGLDFGFNSPLEI
ncbi:carbonic anhydrase 2-like [Cornus florida]|uniref:carbonic anhydrase 2-like n=1 Tax=Cornus florida TaxID=4283 RepID=UPI00289EA3EC|nr:carbonic anhydrase 2-like [Cornus florida]